MRLSPWLPLLAAAPAIAGAPAVREKSVRQPMDAAYVALNKALEDNALHAVFEPDIGANLDRLGGKWGADSNRGRLEGVEAMVSRNGRYANGASGADPAMAALCPLVSLTHEASTTTVPFLRPPAVAKGSAAEQGAAQIEQEVLQAIEGGLGGK